ncbi:MAG: glycosyltransferase family 9 protein [Spirochaetes bacterium]|nr:glycosyltransferase family 9 protein [Spirochaetota bacterium]
MAFKEKILIIRLSSLGDVALVHPVIKKLHQKGHRIDLLTQKEYAPLFQANPFLEKIMAWDKKKGNFSRVIKLVKDQKYDMIIDLQKNLRTFWLRIFFPGRSVTLKKYKFRRWLLINFKINFLNKNSVVKNYLATLTKLGYRTSAQDAGYEIFSLPETAKKVKKLFKKGKRFITVAPMAKWETKIWWGYKELVSMLSKKFPVLLLGTEEEAVRMKKWVTGKNIFNLAGKLGILEMVEVIRQSSLLITNDSGIMHLGAGTETPLIAIFGCTTRGLGFFPLRDNVRIIEVDQLRCRPCDYHGKDKCPRKHFKCMKNISVEMVLDQVRRSLWVSRKKT